jgi:serine/threonine protein kinase/HAMP domain-containing protein
MTAQLPPSEVLARGDMVGEYRVVGRHATGGMGAVYEATHPLIGKRVAVKVIHGRLSKNNQAVQRFIDEARAVNRIGHPNIVDIFAFGTLSDGRCYFVMEWLEGESLHDRMMRGFLGVAQTIEVLSQLTDALAAAHAAGIVHRDLKPANIHLVKRASGVEIKLLDFGIAKLGGREAGGGATLGTPEFISPEQAQGGTVDASTDVYALGALAFALFMGRLPFFGSDARSVIESQITQPVPDPASVWPQIPPVLSRLLLAMLAKRPEQRPSLEEIRAELGRLDQARALNEVVNEAKLSKSKRPVLLRSFDRLGALARVLMDDLSAGVNWVSPVGEPPPIGTPIIVRYQIEDYGIAIDFPGLLEKQMSAPEAIGGAVKPRALVRFDRVPKDDLGRIVSVTGGLGEGDPEGRETEAEWTTGAFPPRWSLVTPPEWKRRERTTTPLIALADRPTEVIPHKDGHVTQPVELEDITHSQLSISRGAPKPQKQSVFGLGAKVLSMTALVTVCSVIAVMVLALRTVSVDRAYYFEELSVRTSLYLADTLRARRIGWQSELTNVLAGTIATGDLSALGHCTERGCEALRGKLPDSGVAHVPKKSAITMKKVGSDLVVSLSDGKATAVGVVPEAKIIDPQRLPAYLSAWVIDSSGEVLAAVGPKAASRAALSHVDPANAGGGPFRDQDGEEMLGAWSGAGEPRVVVAVPKSVASRALETLRNQFAGAMAAVLAVATLAALLFARTLTRRLRLLTMQTAKIKRGEFSEVERAGAMDEVGQLARSFQEMTDALRERDEEVREIQRRMSRAEARAVQRQLAESLETQLAPTLESMRSLLDRKLESKDPQQEFEARQARLRHLHQRAASAVHRALALTSIVSRRVDLASAVSEAIAHLKKRLGPSAPSVKLFAANAVLFPRLDVGESELREIVMTLVERWNAVYGAPEPIEVRLSHRGSELWLAMKYPPAKDGRKVLAAALSEIQHLVVDASASAAVREEAGRATLLIAFKVDLEAEDRV